MIIVFDEQVWVAPDSLAGQLVDLLYDCPEANLIAVDGSLRTVTSSEGVAEPSRSALTHDELDLRPVGPLDEYRGQ